MTISRLFSHACAATLLTLGSRARLPRNATPTAGWPTAAAGAGATGPAACQVRETGMRPAAGALTVDPGQNGGVAIYGWDRDSIAVVAKIEASARSDEDARQLVDAVRIEAAGNAIRASGPVTPGRTHWSVSFDVYVPRHTDLSLETVNGPLSVEDVSGTMDLRAQNGPVSLSGVGGDITARVQNGPLSVELSGTKWDGTGLDAEARNGPVDLCDTGALQRAPRNGNRERPDGCGVPAHRDGAGSRDEPDPDDARPGRRPGARGDHERPADDSPRALGRGAVTPAPSPRGVRRLLLRAR